VPARAFLGPGGVGKPHLANALGQLACLRGDRFILAADLVNDLVAGQDVAPAPRGQASARLSLRAMR